MRAGLATSPENYGSAACDSLHRTFAYLAEGDFHGARWDNERPPAWSTAGQWILWGI